MTTRKDISRENLYEAVKTLVETEAKHIHLPQQKLFTLFSIGFQYLLYRSTKVPGYYIIRIDDSFLADKLARKAKDDVSRKFLQRLILPRRLKYGESTFFLDFFNLSTWAITNDLPQEKIKGALIVKNTSKNPLMDGAFDETEPEEKPDVVVDLPEDYYLTSLMSFAPKTVTIAYDVNFEGTEKISFPFIKENKSELFGGVKISDDLLDELED